MRNLNPGDGGSRWPEMQLAGDEPEAPEMWPATYPPEGEDAETPWLPTDPIPNPEPEAPGLGMPDPGIYHAAPRMELR